MRLVVIGALLLSGCAGLDAVGCRHANWYDLGFRDAIFGIQRQDDVYTLQCEPHGVKVDVGRYVEGWVEGKYESDRRRAMSHD
jgi:hypothetical protein